MNRLLNLGIYLRNIYILVHKEEKLNLQDIADLFFISLSTNFYHVSTLGTAGGESGGGEEGGWGWLYEQSYLLVIFIFLLNRHFQINCNIVTTTSDF